MGRISPKALLLCVVLEIFSCRLLLAQVSKPLTNADIVNMTKAGLNESLIAKAIETQETDFDVSPSALIELKKAGVSQDIIELMVDKTPVGYKDTLSDDDNRTQNPPVSTPAPLDPPLKTPGERPSPPGEDVKAPQVIYKVDPEYSEQARKANFQGKVVLNLVVQKDGTVRDIRVVQSLEMGLDEKAVEAVRQWRFRPGLKNGQPVDVSAIIEVTFRLPNDPDPAQPLEPQPLQPHLYPPPTAKSTKGSGVMLVNYTGLPGEPMVGLLEKARKLTNAMPGVIVAVTPPSDDRVSVARSADFVSECTLRVCAQEEIPKSREFATNGGYIILRLVKQSSGYDTAMSFFRVAVHEFRHVKDIQESKGRVASPEWSRNRKTPHDDRPEEIRANKTVAEVMKKLRERRDPAWDQMLTQLGGQMDQKWFTER